MSRRTRAPRLRRTWPQRMLITFNLACIVVALVAATSLAYAKRKVEQIDRIVLSNEFKGSSGLSDTDPRNFLLVGADSDDGLAPNDPARAGRDDGSVGGIRSDTIMVVRLDPKTNQAKVVSFPRDLWVEIPGNGTGKINSSLQFGGADLLIETLKSNFDIDINHYVQVNFAGFKSLVKQLGGVPVWFSSPVRDTHSGLNVENAGCTTLDENGALSYVRSRYFQYYDEQAGRWRGDPTSDIGRISRQQDFIKRVLRRAISQGARNPTKLAGFVDTGASNITLDEETTPGDLIDLGSAFKNFDPATLETFNLPVVRKFRGGADGLDLQTSTAEPILAMFRGTGDDGSDGTVSPAAVSVQVLNGSGTQDQATDTAGALAAAGFHTLPPNSAPGVAQTEIRYAPGLEAEAALVARYLFANVAFVPDVDAHDVTLVTGPDFQAVLATPRPEAEVSVPTTASTTTSSSTTTTTEAAEAPDAGGTTTTTLIGPDGYVPGPPPEGEDCG